MLLDRYADVEGQEIVFEAGDIPTMEGDEQSRFRIREVLPAEAGSVEVHGWYLNGFGWPDGREVKFTLPVVTFNARRTHR